jgi:pimeloyl-ACP methyl ester carboxylesterase
MPESSKHSREIFSGSGTSEAKNIPESQLDEQGRRFEIEIRGQKFGFFEIQSVGPSNTLLVYFPGFGEDAEQYVKPMHVLMGKSYCTLALKGYGEAYSRESLVEALGQAIQLSGKQNTILQGNSFGAAVVYDLVSDPAGREFLKRNNVVGAILETPVLDKEHLHSRARLIPDNILTRGALLLDSMRSLNSMRSLRSLAPAQGSVELSHSQKKSMIREALREKTADRQIEVPVHVVFTQNENLSDNGKIIQTLQSQAKKISSSTVMSADDNGHHVADDQYEYMWREEKKVIDGFVNQDFTP